MFNKTYQATHPSMIDGISNEALCDLYQVTDLFVADQISLNYTHNERMVIGGAAPVGSPVALPNQTAPVEGAPFLERRELGVINVGEGAGQIVVDGDTQDLEPRDGLYIPMGSEEVTFSSNDSAKPAKFYLASTPAHARFELVKISIKEAVPVKLGSLEESNDRTIYKYVVPETCKSASFFWGLRFSIRAASGTRCHRISTTGVPKSTSTSSWARTSGYSTSWVNRIRCATS